MKKNTITDIDKIEKFLEKEMNISSDLIIIKLDNGSYNLFNKYIISNTEQGHYLIKSKSFTKRVIFSSVKNAATVCIFNKNKKFKECSEIEKLDDKIASKEIDIAQHTKILGNTIDSELKFIHLTKLEEDQFKKQLLIKEMNRFINTFKKWQSKKYASNKPAKYNKNR